ncbi:hypothetical protein [Salinispora sp. H7-4]|uniref:YunG family protein n=1 Tax=Salinispora sp. H7-4 TaxID=2748321 RepID=UPI0015D1C7F4|nr:hypothetical protein [Salinispora sp. H7-4]NYT94066.1 hypothetical protein [Salinispora sp. H7-4]
MLLTSLAEIDQAALAETDRVALAEFDPALLTDIDRAFRASWSAETCDPVDLPWAATNPARGQCGVTALVLRELIGGELLCAVVLRRDGSQQGMHLWNRLPGGVEIDLTREQFTVDEIVQEPAVLPPGPLRRCVQQAALLRHRVRGMLGLPTDEVAYA